MTTGTQDRASAWQQRLGEGFERLAIERLLALDPEETSCLMLRLLEAFEDALRSQMLLLEAASARGDMQGCRRAAHAVRSASNSMGAVAFAQACQALELQAHALGDQARSVQALQGVQQHAQEVAQQGRALLLQVQRVLRDEQA